MGRPRNPVPSTKVSFTTTPQVVRHLERLVLQGLHGKNTGEAAERLVALAVQGLLEGGVLLKPEAPPGQEPGR